MSLLQELVLPASVSESEGRLPRGAEVRLVGVFDLQNERGAGHNSGGGVVGAYWITLPGGAGSFGAWADTSSILSAGHSSGILSAGHSSGFDARVVAEGLKFDGLVQIVTMPLDGGEMRAATDRRTIQARLDELTEILGQPSRREPLPTWVSGSKTAPIAQSNVRNDLVIAYFDGGANPLPDLEGALKLSEHAFVLGINVGVDGKKDP